MNLIYIFRLGAKTEDVGGYACQLAELNPRSYIKAKRAA